MPIPRRRTPLPLLLLLLRPVVAAAACPPRPPCRAPPHSAPVVDGQPTGPNTANIVVTPPAVGGPWERYILSICKAGTTDCKEVECAAKPSGTTTCPVDGPDPDTDYTVEAKAVRPDGQESLLSNIDPFTTSGFDKPTLVADAVSPVLGKATVTPPTNGRPWATYNLKVCKVVAGVVDNASCRQVNGCKANASKSGKPGTKADPADTNCPIPGCEAETVYRVWATALKTDGTESPQSNPDDFTTPQHSAPVIQVDDAKTTKTTAVAVVTPPVTAPTGGWTSYELEVCPVKPAGACVKSTCNNPPQPSPTTTNCDLTGLTEGTEYTVQATAVKGPVRSLPSNLDNFVTKPADVVQE